MSHKIMQALYMFAQYGDEPLTLLKESGHEFFLNDTGRRATRDDIMEWGKDCTGIVAGVEPYDAEVLDAMPRLKCISRCGVGVDSIDLEAAKERGIVVRNTPEVVVRPVVELTVGMIFDLMRRLSQNTGRLRERRWDKVGGNLLMGKKVGILGMGMIGRSVAEMLLKLDCEVIGYDVAPDGAWAKKAGVTMTDEATVLAEADILCLHMSVLADNPFYLDAAKIATMKDGAWVVNTSRGTLIDDGALADALASGKLAGAALDVFPQEPYSGPLCDLENVVLTPHVATLTRESRLQMETEAVRNLLEELK